CWTMSSSLRPPPRAPLRSSLPCAVLAARSSACQHASRILISCSWSCWSSGLLSYVGALPLSEPISVDASPCNRSRISSCSIAVGASKPSPLTTLAYRGAWSNNDCTALCSSHQQRQTPCYFTVLANAPFLLLCNFL